MKIKSSATEQGNHPDYDSNESFSASDDVFAFSVRTLNMLIVVMNGYLKMCLTIVVMLLKLMKTEILNFQNV